MAWLSPSLEPLFTSNGELVWANSTLGNCYDFNVQTYDGKSVPHAVQLRHERLRRESQTDLHEFNIVKPENKTVLVPAFHTIPVDLSSIGGPVDGWYSNDVVQWTTFDHISLLESYNNISLTGEGFSEADPFDAVHINSIDEDKEGNYIISARHSQAVYKIAANGTILWRLGGKFSDFTAIGDDIEFHFQYHARWRMDETCLSLYDDGAAVFVSTVVIRDEPVATGKYLKVVDQEMTISLTKRFFSGTNKNCSLAEGSIESYGDTVVLGYGSLPWTEAYSFDTEELLFSAVIGPNNASLWNGDIHLRVHGHPTPPPNVSVTGGDIYVSWNGTTHVASYTLFTGESAQEISKKVTRVPKSGFETKISAKGSQDFISVAAQAANGTTLGQSAVYRLSDGTIA
ncbi:ASST-domain-containing protein [Mycena galopus ATCC 62051]|nr:ASST-domain-containing protein [Mycena galopus ATCC 62051]